MVQRARHEITLAVTSIATASIRVGRRASNNYRTLNSNAAFQCPTLSAARRRTEQGGAAESSEQVTALAFLEARHRPMADEPAFALPTVNTISQKRKLRHRVIACRLGHGPECAASGASLLRGPRCCAGRRGRFLTLWPDRLSCCLPAWWALGLAVWRTNGSVRDSRWGRERKKVELSFHPNERESE